MENIRGSVGDNISVVIATSGGEFICDTIDSINASTVIPSEILICMPEKEAANFNFSQYMNVNLIPTKCRGQVAQRAVGFGVVKNEVVIQLDDDMLLTKDCIEKLYATIKKCGPFASVSPALYDLNTKETVYKKVIFNNRWLQKFYYRLTNGNDGYKMGVVDLTGSEIGVDPGNTSEEAYAVEWLPGGCVMHYRLNLVLDNYFLLPGKAYCEDLIHSYLLRKKNISLYISTSAVCYFADSHYSDCSFFDFIKMLKCDFRARKYYLQMRNIYTVRIYLFYIFMLINYIKNI